MAGGYGFWGGMAQGFGQGVELVEKSREAKERERKRQREKEADVLMDEADKMPGTIKDPGIAMTPEAILERRADAKKRDRRPGLFGILTPKMDPAAASAQAGIPTAASVAAAAPAAEVGGAPAGAGIQPAAQASAAPAEPAPAAVAPAAGIPASAPAASPAEGAEVDPVVVQPTQERYSETDALRLRIAALYKRGDEAAAGALMQQLHTLQTRDANTELALAGSRGVPGIVNVVDKNDPNGEWDYEETDDPTKFRILRNGTEVGVWTREEALEQAAAIVNADPMMPARMSMVRGQAARAERQIMLSERVQKSNEYFKGVQANLERMQIGIAQQNANTSAALANSTIEQNNVETQRLQAQVGALQQSQSFYQAVSGAGGGPDLLLNPQLGGIAVQLDSGVTAKDETTGQLLTPHQTLYGARRATAMARFEEINKVTGGKVHIKQTPQGALYAVEGDVRGGKQVFYNNLDEAEMAARRLYVKKAPAKAAK